MDVVVVATGSADAGLERAVPNICDARVLSLALVAIAVSIMDRSVDKSPPLDGNRALHIVKNFN